LQHAEEIIETFTEPAEFEHFRRMTEVERVNDTFSETKFKEVFPLKADLVATIGTKGELMLWQIPSYDLILRLKVNPEETPYYIDLFNFN